MKYRLKIAPGFYLLAAGLLLMAAPPFYGIAGQDDAKPSTGQTSARPGETWAFWEALNKTVVSGQGIEMLRLPAYSEQPRVNDTCDVLNDIIAGERARSRAITSLPVLHVDPDLAAYAVAVAQSRLDIADVLLDCISLERRQEEITSAPALGVGLMLNLINRSDEKEEGIFWRALLDQAKQTSGDLQSLRKPAAVLDAKANSVRRQIERIGTQELAVRAKLSQRFGREFPTLETYLTAAAQAKARENDSIPESEIKRTLIGSSIPGPFGTWQFDHPEEFVSFKINSVKNRTDVLTDYVISTHVKGIPSGGEHDFNMRVTYGRFYTRWILVEIRRLR